MLEDTLTSVAGSCFVRACLFILHVLECIPSRAVSARALSISWLVSSSLSPMLLSTTDSCILVRLGEPRIPQHRQPKENPGQPYAVFKLVCLIYFTQHYDLKVREFSYRCLHVSFFMAELRSMVCTHYIYFLHSSADGHTGCFQDWAHMHRAETSLGVHASLRYDVFNFFRKMLRRGTAGLKEFLVLVL